MRSLASIQKIDSMSPIRYSYGSGKRKMIIVLAAAAAVIMLVAGAAFGYIYALKPTRINYGTSEVFLGNERVQAGAEIIRTVSRWDGVKLLSVSYAGDEASQKEAEYYNSISEFRKEMTDYLVYEVEIFSPFSRGAWIGMYTYHWKWIMVQIEPGVWETLTYGEG